MSAAPDCLPTHERILLLVDDEENILAALKRMLRRDGYRILTAGSGEEGLARLGETAVGVIVSDQRMPGMTGTEFLSQVKDLYPDTIRMVLSGYTDINSIADAINQGAIYKFLAKPWEDDLLRGHIAEAFQRYEMKQDNLRLAAINQAMLNAVQEIVLFVDINRGTILSANRGAVESLGYPASALIGRPLTDIEVMPQDAFAWEEIRNHQFAPMNRVETAYLHAAGHLVPVAKSTALTGIGEDRGLVVVAQDLSLQRAAEAQLASAQSEIASILESTVEGLLVIGNSDELLGMNHHLARLWALDQSMESAGSALLTRLGLRCLPPRESADQLLAALADREHDASGLLRHADQRCLAWAKRPQRVRGEIVGQVFSFFLLSPGDYPTTPLLMA